MIEEVKKKKEPFLECLVHFTVKLRIPENFLSSCSSSDNSGKSADRPSFTDREGAQPYLFEPFDSDGSSGTDYSLMILNKDIRATTNTLVSDRFAMCSECC